MWNSALVKFGGEEFAQICRKEIITINRKNKIEDVLYVKGLKHNLLNVRQI